ncbi:MAG: PaaI family thioesterase [Variibacter sp.]|nr:PaaI family thioesterase [Variibacter sp.]
MSSAVWTSGPPLARHLGIDDLGAADGTARLRLQCRPEIANRKGDIHGGAVAALLDMVAANAIRSVAQGAAALSTVTLTTSYIAPARGTLFATGKVQQIGGTIAFAEARAEDDAGRLVASAQGSWRIIRAAAMPG